MSDPTPVTNSVIVDESGSTRKRKSARKVPAWIQVKPCDTFDRASGLSDRSAKNAITDALLFEADLSSADLSGATLKSAKLGRARLNAANLTFVSFAKALDDIGGQVIVFFTLVVAAAEVAVGLAIIIAIFRRRQSVSADDVDLLKG